MKGHGVDCAQLLYQVYRRCKLIPKIAIPHYPPQWHLHRGDEKFENLVRQYAKQVESPLPGDIVLYREGRAFAHGAIVLDWPRIVHASAEVKMVVEDEGTSGRLADRERRFYSIWTD